MLPRERRPKVRSIQDQSPSSDNDLKSRAAAPAEDLSQPRRRVGRIIQDERPNSGEDVAPHASTEDLYSDGEYDPKVERYAFLK